MKATSEQAKIESLMRDVDRTLLRENLKLTPAQRLEKFVNVARFTSELRRAGERMRRRAVQTAKA
jgi:hypothetical protein